MFKHQFLSDIVSTAASGERVQLSGWVETIRDLGQIVFIELRDRTLKVQLVFESQEVDLNSVKNISPESVITVRGVFNKLTQKPFCEVKVDELEIHSIPTLLPFQPRDAESVTEVNRLKYRYIDLRRPFLQANLKLRHDVLQFVRAFFSDHGFLEVETPVLYKSTPEGARDFLVPCRLQRGTFYALPQSPQTLKQTLMIAGVGRYFQLAKCFRDEDLRADRQPEFTQIDLEASFVTATEIRKLNQALLEKIFEKFLNFRFPEIPIFTYDEALRSYGVDKPDLRIPERIEMLSEKVLTEESFLRKFFQKSPSGESEAEKTVIYWPIFSSEKKISRSELERLLEPFSKIISKELGEGLGFIQLNEDQTISGSLKKQFNVNGLRSLISDTGERPAPVTIIFAWGLSSSIFKTLGRARLELGKYLFPSKLVEHRACWVVDFPMFEWNELDQRFEAMHHPFTSPKREYLALLEESEHDQILKIRAEAYDLVVNGIELGGGSVRNFDTKVQEKIFQLIGLSKEETKSRFGFFLQALESGCPPHGGFAWGFDRLVATIAGVEAIRDVIAFPKTASGSDLMSGAPTSVEPEQIWEAFGSLIKK